MAYSTETQNKLTEWREKAKEGRLTQEEMKEAIILLRQGRFSACFAGKAAKSKAVVPDLPSAEQLIEELKAIGCIATENLP